MGSSERLQEIAQIFDQAGPLAQQLKHFVPRAEQQALAQAIAQTLSERSILVAEAGTGIGKTFAYLVPALLSGGRVVLATGTRHLQDQLFERDLPTVQQALGLSVRTAVLKGRTNYVCRYRLTKHRRDGRFPDPSIPEALRQIDRFAALSQSGDRAACTDLDEEHAAWAWATSTRDNCLGQECPEIQSCFVYRARREAQQADVVVVNHHLLGADIALREDNLAELLPHAEAVVIDEAHQFPDVLTEFLGEGISTRQCHDLARDLLAAGAAHAPDGALWWQLAGSLDEAASALVGCLAANMMPERSGPRLGAAGRRWSAAQLRVWPTLAQSLDNLQASLAEVAAVVVGQHGRAPELDRCGERAGELLARTQRWVRVWQQTEATPFAAGPEEPEHEAAVVWAECQPTYAALRCTPLSPSAGLARFRAGRPRAWMLLSATLTVAGDFAPFLAALGLDEARCVRWGSPFDYARQAALWVPRGLGAPASADFTYAAVDAVWPLLRANQGRALILCTTLRAMRIMAARLAQRNAVEHAGLKCLVQGDAPRHTLLEQFRRESAAVLCGSAGFWAGVDVVGDALSLVVIDKLPFAPPEDPVLQARSDALRRAGRDPFMEVHLPAAALMLQQGAGRLIRSERDRGVLVVCDERLLTRGYGRRLLASLPPFTQVSGWQEALPYLPPAFIN